MVRRLTGLSHDADGIKIPFYVNLLPIALSLSAALAATLERVGSSAWAPARGLQRVGSSPLASAGAVDCDAFVWPLTGMSSIALTWLPQSRIIDSLFAQLSFCRIRISGEAPGEDLARRPIVAGEVSAKRAARPRDLQPDRRSRAI